MYVILFSLSLIHFYAALQILWPKASIVIKGMFVFAEKIKTSKSVLSNDIFFRECVT